MFINRLIDFYKSKLSQNNLIFKYIKVYYILFYITIIISSVSFVWLLSKHSWLYLLIPILTYILAIIIFSVLIKRTILKKHKISISPFISSNSWTEYKVKLLKVYLKQHNCLEKNKIKSYIEFLEKESNNKKPSNYIIFGVPGLLIAFFVPVWNNFNSWVFNHEINILNDGIGYIVMIFIILFIVSFFIGIIKLWAKDLLESDYQKIKDLTYLLELVHVSIDEPVIDDTILNRLR